MEFLIQYIYLIYYTILLLCLAYFKDLSGMIYTGAESLQDRLGNMWTLLNNLGFSLCTTLSVCHIVTTSDNRKKSEMGVSADLVYCCWTPEIEFNKSLSSSIIRLANYSVTTSLIYKFLL